MLRRLSQQSDINSANAERSNGADSRPSRRQSQRSNDSFGGFIDATPTPRGLHTPLEGNPDSFIDGDDEVWQDAEIAVAFSPIESNHSFNSPGPSQHHMPPTKQQQQQQQQLNDLDWEAWETPRGPSPGPEKGQHADLLSAYEHMSLHANPLNRPPSPPIIDLRDMSKKLDQQKALKASGLHADDLRFFESFDNDPRGVMASSRQDSHNKDNMLDGDQLFSMHEAQASPLDVRKLASTDQHTQTDYFSIDSDLNPSSQSHKVIPSAEELGRPEDTKPSSQSSGSWTDTAGNWAGSLRKTLGTFRGHLPSARDFYVADNETVNASPAPSAGPANIASIFQDHSSDDADKDVPIQSPSSEQRAVHSRKLADRAKYSQSTPFSSTTDGTLATSPVRNMFPSSSGIQSGTASAMADYKGIAPVSGAPGFNGSNARNWNTGSWSLTSEEELARRNRPIPVTLKGRRDETQDVVSDTLAAQLTARLPKRHQLGKTWKLLYSSDQHGVSLSTLYAKVANGLDVGGKDAIGARRSAGGGGGGGGGGVENAEGWLRGASEAARSALAANGTNSVKRVGGGLSLNEAGLVLAIKDDDEHVFGAFVNERLRAQTSYYGNGECFLWKQCDSGEVCLFPWTGRNDYMILTEAHYLSFGGGEGKYGLWLDGRLEQGVSSWCPAFDNDVLCDGRDRSAKTQKDKSTEGRFECITLEVWACGID